MNKARGIVAVVAMGWFAAVTGESIAAVADTHGVCASTPAAALLAIKGTAGRSSAALPGAQGYRVQSVRWDSLQRRNWAVIESCDHSERPSITVPMDMPAPVLLTASSARPYAIMPIVRAGDLVRLWKRDRYAHIEMIATAEENGAVGTRVRVRLTAPKDADGQSTQPQYFAGVVRGPADVEMEP
jgi:hypothetical protein